MLRRVFLIFSSLITLSSAGAAETLDPIQNWVVDYREDECLATREYGSSENPVILGIRPAPNGETYEMLVSRKHSGPDFATEQKGYVDFGNGRINSWLLNYGFKKTRDVYQFRVTAAEMQQALTAKTLLLKPERRAEFAFSLSSIPALLAGLQTCTADLKQYWNMGRAEQSIATPSKGDIRFVFRADDYPSEAFSRGQGGDSQFLLLIDEKGNVAGCHVLEPSGVPILDAMGCQVIRKRAKFIPAKDARGNSIRSTVVTPKVVWRME